MTKSEWIAIAEALKAQRNDAAASWPPKGGHSTIATEAHDRKLIHFARLEGIDNAARAVCAVLKSHSSRFDSARFLRMVGVERRRR